MYNMPTHIPDKTLLDCSFIVSMQDSVKKTFLGLLRDLARICASCLMDMHFPTKKNNDNPSKGYG